jgi:hypothetical protein
VAGDLRSDRGAEILEVYVLEAEGSMAALYSRVAENVREMRSDAWHSASAFRVCASESVRAGAIELTGPGSVLDAMERAVSESVDGPLHDSIVSHIRRLHVAADIVAYGRSTGEDDVIGDVSALKCELAETMRYMRTVIRGHP